MAPLPGKHISNYLRSEADLKVANDSSDVLLNLDYELFIKDLIKEAERLSEKDGAHEILPAHIMRAKELVLRRYQG